MEIIFITVCAVICGCENWSEIEDYAEAKKEWFKQFLDLKNDQICIDSKTLRHCFKSRLTRTLHMVSAWSSATSLSLGQIATEEKSNEITAVPELLKILEIKGCLVSLDATEELFRRSSTTVKKKLRSDDYELSEKNNHGRDEMRSCRVIYFEKEVGFFPHKDWTDVSSIIRIKSERMIRSTGEITSEVRYYVSSVEKSAREFNSNVRNHWGIENKLYWSLDVALNEDDSRIWAEESGTNFSLLRKMVLNLLKREPAKKGIRRKQKIAALSDQYLLKVLFTS